MQTVYSDSYVMLVLICLSILTYTGGVLSGQEPSRCGTGPSCPKYEHYTKNDPTCLRTCANRHVPRGEDCKPYTGCVCDDDLVRLYDNATGPCMPAKKCPNKCKDPNAVYTKCPSPCPLTCDEPDPRPCSKMCLQYGCECAPGYVLSEIGGKCIRTKDCPALCRKREHYVENDEACLKTCGNRLLPHQDTAGACRPFTGCVCNAGFVRKYDNATGPCIRAKSCPPIPKCGVNEVPTSCRIVCPPQTCDSIFTSYYCVPSDCEPGCDCRDNYLRNSKGVCILSDDCFKNRTGCYGDLNATHVDCGSACPATCAEPDSGRPCIAVCVLNGCQCNPGYILNEPGGVCIAPSDCPGGSPTCGANQTYVGCKVGCPSNYCPEDDSRAIVACSAPYPCPGGCACQSGYLLVSRDDERCILASECPPVNCTRPNEVWEPNPSNCFLERCEDRGKVCDFPYPAQPRCVCKHGYYRNESDICIPESECPDVGCNGDPNAMPKDCPSSCPPTCANRNTKRTAACIDACLPGGCVCKPGFILTEIGGICVRPEECPGELGCKGDRNATFKDCLSACPLTCADQDANKPCLAICLPSGCECNPGYVLTEKDGKCIKPEDCPAEPQCNGDRNATFKTCPSPCQATCEKPDTDGPCIDKCMPDGCVCKQGYLLTKIGGICIKPGDCPAKQECGYNEVGVPCRTICPPQNCEIAYNDYYCTKESKRCEQGCDCLPDHLRNGSGICIPNEECPYPTSPICSINEIARDCKRICPPQTCTSKYALYRCKEDIPCEPGCDCVANYLRDANGICIPSEECPPLCSVPDKCIRTCSSPNPPDCSYSPPDENIDGCDCKEGYILSELGGKCIKIEDCPRGCNGDRHARTKRCPLPCPSTCQSPNAIHCLKMCEPIGCECEPGYILSNSTGKCILPDECPGQNPCGKNEHFVACKVNCPRDYCPKNDRRGIVICDPPQPCLSGCVCNLNHKRKSQKDPRCIVSSDCPPVTCTRPNEVWDSCPSACLAENCEDVNRQPTVCNTLVLNCEPACICKKDYFRNATDICIPARACPCPIPDKCKRTCASPNPSGCPYSPPNDNVDGCDCKEGYILEKLGGKCIKIEECPRNLGCNGDPHAITKKCPHPCPSTCQAPNAVHCEKMCEPIACECEPGYILSNSTGKCILPEECPGGNPCGENENFVTCKVPCPRDYCPVDDSRAVVVCDPPRPCLSGCVCNFNHKRKSREDPRCIVASDCPPVKCTRPNEGWSSCPSCLDEDCEDVNHGPTFCAQWENCHPACICKEDYLRNATGICIPNKDCPCPISNKCKRTCAAPNPPGCSYSSPSVNIDGCTCKEGYILSKLGGKCIRIEDCPRNLGCNGDPHAITKACPHPCPSTCQAPNAIQCKRKCEPIACECEPGYILSNSTGKCILPDECPGGNPCGENEDFVACKVPCPRDYCPADDSRAVVVCDPPRPCLSGCVCNFNHKRKSREDPRCIVASDCPPVKCTRPNEKWSSCPSECLAEDCDDVNHEPYVCPMWVRCEPVCTCEKDYLRNATGICIPNKDCPCPIPNKCKRTCAAPNPAGCSYSPPSVNIDGCTCKEGYILSKLGGKCIRIEDCPPCPIPDKCKRTCASPNPSGCPYSPPNDNVDGCDCKEGYILEKLGGKCIKIEECPRNLGCNGDPHAITKKCPHPCPSTCQAPNAVHCEKMCEPIACECEPGYILSNSTGKCILPEECPGGNPCGENENFVTCKVPCPRDYCPVDDSRAVVVCDPPRPCLSGCVCNFNHKRKSREDPRCIVASDCPPVKCARPNEGWSSCPSCLDEDCEDVNHGPTFCAQWEKCHPACICKEDYLRNATGICIPNKDCPCPISNKCKRTCAAPNPPGCSYSSPSVNIDGCTCKEGYILSKLGGKCIRIEDCPRNLGCNGDPHAITKACPHPCPSTCQAPNAIQCKRKCEPIACECETGYILSNSTGKCILPDECPGGNPCGENEDFVACKVPCPRDYCPADDSRAVVVCNPPRPCLSGCVCNFNHKRKSRDDPRCIVASDCPPVKCTRPNEKWSSCPSECLAEDCDDVNHEPYVCPMWVRCEPACTCEKDYLRNATGICIPNKDCPCPIPNKCKRTCAAPNPAGCSYSSPSVNIDGCTCKEGYILSKLGGKCIRIEDCPRNLGCNGDPHAITKACPQPCPSTCDSPNAFPCKRKCDAFGCECEPGYLISNVTGKCILPDKCPGGNPCGKNERFVACKVNCPQNYCPVDDSRAVVVCDPPRPCLSGCICDLNHKRKSRKDPRCIVSSDCPPVTCTRPNEVWDSCPSACLAKNCEDVNRQPTVCNTLVLNCEPACICKKDYFRNATDICIPARDCPCPVPDKCKRTCGSPNPPGCPYSPPNDNVDGCDCKEGYILAKLGGKCIKVEDCPRDLGCNGDPNALTKRCPLPCPSTCKAPDAAPCKKACEPIGCQCKPGYLLSNVTGRCILPDDCPGGNPCGENAHFVDCKVNGPRDYCPKDDSRAILERLTMPRCLPGCICNINHKRKSQEDQRCIVSSDCPPVTCTRPNEVWDSCPSACLAENCKDINRQPTVCNTLVLNCEPACICKHDYFRNATDICICARDCPCPVPDKCKRTCASPNPSGCPYKSPNVNIDGCDCKKGYILSKLGGKCIRVECCPPC